MSAYCEKSDIYPKKIPTVDVLRLTDDSGLKTQMDEDTGAIVDQSITDMSALIDTSCQKVYTIPLTPVPDIILKYCVDMVIYDLHSRRTDIDVPEDRLRRYDDAILFLKKITEGEKALGATTPVESSSVNEVDFESNTAEFTRDKLQDF